eukprot:TRINITY_DN23907_c0_g1_i1.p1 TRINITY_DN23907_c0_g1~~TRINITY_DN23907_c0_g1_i1.p1  ORF type:complete len:118 (+),score=8.97 TRINITY_DN23907_c0_g1_i1:175-528(+)
MKKSHVSWPQNRNPLLAPWRFNAFQIGFATFLLVQFIFTLHYSNTRVKRGENALLKWKWPVCEIDQLGGDPLKNNYGAWTLCDNHVRTGGIVYSFGIGADVSFDNAILERGGKVSLF